jgi:hypothetical protein
MSNDEPKYIFLQPGHLASNTASIVIDSFSNPVQPAVFVYGTEADTKKIDATEKGTTAYKIVLIFVIGFTLIAFAAYVIMPAVWPSPTDIQKTAFEGASFAWKLCLGAVVGLLGAKQL